MKNLIIITGTVILGCMIFSMIAGDERGLKASCANFIKSNVEFYKEQV